MITRTYTEIGGATGFTIGFYRYWDHFNSDTWINLADACLSTLVTTILGASVTYLVVYFWKNFLPHNKK